MELEELVMTTTPHRAKATVRPEIAEFAVEMETILRENDHKSGWDKMTIDNLFFRIKDEFEELEEAYDLYANPLTGDAETRDETQNMKKEAIDLANFCMFLCHNIQTLVEGD